MRRLCLLALLFLPGWVMSQDCENNDCSQGESIIDCPAECWVDTNYRVLENGGRVDWCPTQDLIALDKRGDDKYYDVYTMKPDGSKLKCMTCSGDIPQKHNGQPAWHPNGEWLLFQAERAEHRGRSRFAHPGRGKFNDLWVLSIESGKSYPLVVPDDMESGGVLHAHFSKDGTQLSWSEIIGQAHGRPRGQLFGQWDLRVGQIYFENDSLKIRNIKSYQPFESVFYENHGFSPDGKTLLFTSNIELTRGPLTGNRICTLDLASGKSKVLTQDSYNEHATYCNEGQRIVWGTNRQNTRRGMDYWIMNADGSTKKRLTSYNVKGSDQYTKKKALTIDMSWNGQEDRLIYYMQFGALGKTGDLYMMEVDNR